MYAFCGFHSLQVSTSLPVNYWPILHICHRLCSPVMLVQIPSSLCVLHCCAVTFSPDNTREQDKQRTVLKTFWTSCEPEAHCTIDTSTEYQKLGTKVIISPNIDEKDCQSLFHYERWEGTHCVQEKHKLHFSWRKSTFFFLMAVHYILKTKH